jgi:predicted nucleotidyltransferase
VTYSVPPERPVSETVVAILRDAAEAAKGAGIDYFVGGALARDLLLFHVFGERTTRATRDVDLMVWVDGWDAFEGLKDRLIATGRFTAARGTAHRLHYEKVALDLVPFGGVESPAGTVSWPPDQETVMSVVGLQEAARASIPVTIEEGLTVPVVALAALSLLKVSAWIDRHHETAKDAVDLLILLRLYGAAGNEDRLYGEEVDLLESSGFDPVLAGARLLGRDAARICGIAATRVVVDRLGALLRRELEGQLLRDAGGFEGDEAQARALALFGAYWEELAQAAGRS